MKLYVKIDNEDDSFFFGAFCGTYGVVIDRLPISFGLWCIDNTSKSAHYLTAIEVRDIPKSFWLDWDTAHIESLYNNEIIGRFNQGKLQWTLMNYEALEPMVQVLMYGAKKYDRDNWVKACPNRLDLLDSLARHYVKLVAGESVDPESGLPHIGHLMCNAMFYSYWEQKTNGQFENYKSE